MVIIYESLAMGRSELKFIEGNLCVHEFNSTNGSDTVAMVCEPVYEESKSHSRGGVRIMSTRTVMA
jgi:hypothetical protein